jgi:hypothetical protein
MEKPTENINFYLAGCQIAGANMESESIVLYVSLLATMVGEKLVLGLVCNLLLYTKPHGITQNKVFFMH